MVDPLPSGPLATGPLPSGRWPVVVVGAGPAGALAALGLARQGVPVLLVERRRFPRWKVCGACLSGQALAALAEAGQAPLLDRLGARPLRSVQLGLQGPARSWLCRPGGCCRGWPSTRGWCRRPWPPAPRWCPR